MEKYNYFHWQYLNRVGACAMDLNTADERFPDDKNTAVVGTMI